MREGVTPGSRRRRSGSATTPRSLRASTVEPNVVFAPGVEHRDRRGDPRLLASRGREGRRRRDRGAVRPAAAGRGHRQRRAHRQFRRGEERRRSAKAPRPTTCPISAMARSARARTSARARSSATMTASSNTARSSGPNAFIGSNSALVAPVSIGAGGYVGSGSVIVEDVPADALAIGRGRQASKGGWARTFRDEKSALKKAGRKPPGAV